MTCPTIIASQVALTLGQPVRIKRKIPGTPLWSHGCDSVLRWAQRLAAREMPLHDP